MYNGIGLQTPRGSGTNGHVQRNWAIVRKTKDKVTYKAEENKIDQLNKQPNKEILDHVRKRKVEVKCAELADILENQGFTNEEIQDKVESYRSLLMGTDIKSSTPQDEFGRVNVRETHQIAEAQQEKNAKLREAFGISEFFVEGSSLDPERHAREAEARAAAAAASKVYELVRTPSPAPPPSVPEAIATTATEKKKRKRSGSASAAKKKKAKKHKRERSESPKSGKKKEKSKKKKKEKKHKKAEATSSDSDSSEDSDDSNSSEAESKKKKKKKKKKLKVEGKDKHEN